MILYLSNGKLYVRPTEPGQPPREVGADILKPRLPPRQAAVRPLHRRGPVIKRCRVRADVTA